MKSNLWISLASDLLPPFLLTLPFLLLPISFCLAYLASVLPGGQEAEKQKEKLPKLSSCLQGTNLCVCLSLSGLFVR